MTKKKKIEHEFDFSDVRKKVSKIQKWFSAIPEDWKTDAAECLIVEILRCSSQDHYQALGICEEAKIVFRQLSREATIIDEQLRQSAIDYQCVENLTTTNEKVFVKGKTYQATFESEIYHLYADDGTDCILRKECFERRFEPLN